MLINKNLQDPHVYPVSVRTLSPGVAPNRQAINMAGPFLHVCSVLGSRSDTHGGSFISVRTVGTI